MDHYIEKITIDGSDLKQWFLSGTKEVESNKKELNSTNVFPIADGDTGTNLFYTLNKMNANNSDKTSFRDVIQILSEQGLYNARGNSGIIFASYINGLAKSGSEFDQVSTKEFGQIALGAVDSLYEAVDEPVEGTMISVIREWAKYLAEHSGKASNFIALLASAYNHASEALVKTTQQLAVLKENNVVDSGAAGFVHFLNGINISLGEAHKNRPALIEKNSEPLENSQHLANYKFCTEFFLKESKGPLSTEDIKNLIRPYGDSIVVAKVQDNMRIHIHTDHPELVMEIMEKQGDIIEQKVDETNNTRSKGSQRIGILTDSIADIQEEYKEKHSVHTLPLSIVFGDKWYLDKQTITLNQVIEKIPNSPDHPTSSQPEPGRIREFLEKYSLIYDSLIFICVSSKMSGTYQGLIKEATKMGILGDKLLVVDSKLNSGAQGLILQATVEMVEAGMERDLILEKIEELISKTKIYVCLSTVEFATKGGRIPKSVGRLGMALGMRPIMSIDPQGKGTAFHMGFSQKALTKKIMKLTKEAMKKKGIRSYSIVHAQSPTLVREYEKALIQIIKKEPAFITEISSVVAINSGPGSLALSFIEE
ncbi:MAG: DegV family protein [Anaerovoracaceae bacterium]|jgi:DegV family protein with EDD domain|nr:DegV family protein [Anaerovoracaceae bacterium]